MAVITADGIVGKVREVFPHSAQVLAINDQTSGAGVILETTRIRGILRGNAAGQPQIVGILADQRIQPGEKVLTAGGDQIFPRGLPVGVVEKVVRDPERDSFIDVIVKPAAHLDRLDEVLVITSTEPRFSPEEQQDLATSEALKGAEAAAIKEQKKASEIMAERLPGLTDPNLPPDQQPLYDSSNPNPVAHPPQALHPDRFTPGAAAGIPPEANPGRAQDAPPDPNKKRVAPARAAAQPNRPPTLQPSQTSQPRAAIQTPGEPIAMPVSAAANRRELGVRRYPIGLRDGAAYRAGVAGLFAPPPGLSWFDLPLVVTIYFLVGRRIPIQGTIMGAALGLFEDALTHHAIGVNGIAITVVGWC